MGLGAQGGGAGASVGGWSLITQTVAADGAQTRPYIPENMALLYPISILLSPYIISPVILLYPYISYYISYYIHVYIHVSLPIIYPYISMFLPIISLYPYPYILALTPSLFPDRLNRASER